MNKITIELASIIIGVLSVSLGFLVYSGTVVIKNEVKVEPNNSTFKINLSTKKDVTSSGVISAIKSSEDLSASDAIITNDIGEGVALISNLHASFKEPNQFVTYRLYVRNDGKYAAYLKSVEFKNIEDKKHYKICKARKGTSQQLVDQVCGNINISIKVRDSLYSNDTSFAKFISIKDHILGIGDNETIEIIISYDDKNSILADGAFDIDFGDIVLTYNVTD